MDGPPTFDEIVSPFYAARDWDGLLGALDRIDPDELEEPEAIQWHTSRGLAAEKLGRRDEAVSAYAEGVRRHPGSSTLHCIRGRLFEEEGRFDEALPHFQAVRLGDGGGNAVMTSARYCYLWDALEVAAALQDQIFSAYFSLGIADDHFLYTRGLPFFTQAYGAQAAVLVLSGEGDAANDLLERCESGLSDLQGTEDERLTLEATLGQPSGLLRYLPGKTRSDGYNAMRLASWRARGSDDPVQAEQELASVKLGDDDWPWLEDVRRLASIAVGRRTGRLRHDDPRLTEFLGRQALLFEPEHAFYFGLLDEQEVQKEAYRERRRELGPPGRRT